MIAIRAARLFDGDSELLLRQPTVLISDTPGSIRSCACRLRQAM